MFLMSSSIVTTLCGTFDSRLIHVIMLLSLKKILRHQLLRGWKRRAAAVADEGKAENIRQVQYLPRSGGTH